MNPESGTDEEYESSVSTEVERSPTTYLNSSVRPKAKPSSGVDPTKGKPPPNLRMRASSVDRLLDSVMTPPAEEVVREKETNKEEGRGSTTGGAGNITLTSSQFKEFLDSVIREGEDYDNIKKIVLTQYGRSLRTIGAQMFPKRRAHIRDRRELAQFVHDEVTRVSMLCTTAEQWEALSLLCKYGFRKRNTPCIYP